MGITHSRMAHDMDDAGPGFDIHRMFAKYG